MEALIDKYGRIVIPKQIRDNLNLEPGAPVRIEERERTIVLKPICGEPDLVMKDGVLVFSGKATGDLEKAVERHREKRLEHAGG